jgi:type IX secretion system PorP/SprF family membrane protein
MVKNYILFLLIAIASLETLYAQEEPVLTFTIPTQNTLQNNRFLINPAFSKVRENDNYITLYHRSQWTEFDDSPELYMISYAGKHKEKAGVGIGLYQQNLGVITSFGGIANYSYEIPLREKKALTFGFNLAYYSSGVNRNKTVTNEVDPLILSLRNKSILTLNPGINLTWGSFDIGVYGENLVDYDFKTSKTVKEYSEKTYTGHVMYNHNMMNQEGLFENGFFRLMLRGKMNKTDDFKYGGSLLVNFPYLGWVQAGVDDYYGVGIGVGGHLTKKLSLGYVYERVINEGLVNFGPTHEIVISYRFAGEENFEAKRKGIPTKNTKKTITTTYVKKIKKPVVIIEEEYEEIEEEIEEEDFVYQEEEEVQTQPQVKTKKTNAIKNNKSTTNQSSSSTETSHYTESKSVINKKDLDYKNIEIEKLKMTLDENNSKLLDIIIKQDSIENLRKEDFEKRVENMMHYIQRLENTIAEKDCNCDHDSQQLENNETEQAKKESKKTNYTTSNTKTNIKSTTNTTKPKNDYETIKKALDKKEPKPTTNTKFTLSDEEIKEYYSSLTDKKRETAKKGNFLTVDNQEPGFYIIANVFSEPAFADSFIKDLKKKGITAQYFINPKNNYRYVYLKKVNNWSDALISYYTNLDNTYYDTIWIMNINIK